MGDEDLPCPRYCEQVCRAAGHYAILGDGPPEVDPRKCVGCGLCVKACLDGNADEGYPLRRPAIDIIPRRVQHPMDPSVKKTDDDSLDDVILDDL